MTNLKAVLKAVRVSDGGRHQRSCEDVQIVGFCYQHNDFERTGDVVAVFIGADGRFGSAPISEFDAVEIDQ